MPKTKDGGYLLHEPEVSRDRYSPHGMITQADEAAEARINEIYARESDKIKKQQKSRKKPPTVKRAGNRKTGKKK